MFSSVSLRRFCFVPIVVPLFYADICEGRVSGVKALEYMFTK